jgi:hypothetical protein
VTKWPRNPRQVCGIPEGEARGNSANLPRVRGHLITNLPQAQPRTQDLSLGKTLAAAGHVPHQKFS